MSACMAVERVQNFLGQPKQPQICIEYGKDLSFHGWSTKIRIVYEQNEAKRNMFKCRKIIPSLDATMLKHDVLHRRLNFAFYNSYFAAS